MAKFRTITISCWHFFMPNMTPPPPVCGNGHRISGTEIKNPVRLSVAPYYYNRTSRVTIGVQTSCILLPNRCQNAKSGSNNHSVPVRMRVVQLTETSLMLLLIHARLHVWQRWLMVQFNFLSAFGLFDLLHTKNCIEYRILYKRKLKSSKHQML